MAPRLAFKQIAIMCLHPSEIIVLPFVFLVRHWNNNYASRSND